MPFAPSVLEEDANKIMHVIKNHKNHYMTISFDVKKNFVDKIPAAVHPFDNLKRSAKLEYY